MSGELAAGPKRYVVRLRWERGAYVSPAMPQHQAEDQAADLHDEIVRCGDGVRFVEFTRHDGGTIRVRGREVIGIEAIPHREDVDLPDTGRRTVTTCGGTHAGHVQAPAGTSGTAYLRAVTGATRATTGARS